MSDFAKNDPARGGDIMQASSQVSLAPGRRKHVIALVVLPDSVAFEVALIQQYFGRPIPILAALTGQTESSYEVVLCGENATHRLSSGMDFGPLAPLDALQTADSVMIPGVEEPLTRRSDAVLQALRDAHEGGARMVSYCGGAFILGQAGLLDGRRATTHWLLSKEFRGEFPLATLEPEHLYVEDGGVHTSGGMLSAADLAMHIIALDRGQKYANDVGRLFVTSPHRAGGQAQFIKESLRLDHDAHDRLLDWIRENLHEPLTLNQLALQEHTSSRSLVRNFRRRHGVSVLDWINRERVARAKVLLETTDLPVAEIAAMVGFGSHESLRRHFLKHTGKSAHAYRRVFRSSEQAS
ncbi:GlxA family transcriptional regulator [Herbiconiux sp. P17]